MKKLKTLLCALFAAALFVGCSEDQLVDDPQPTPEGEGDGFYMGLDILMPTGKNASRSQTNQDGTSTGGTEFGSNEENAVNSALIVLARKSDDPAENYGFIAAGEVSSNNLTSASVNNEPAYKALTRIYKSNLQYFYRWFNNPNANPEVYVFVFCNPTKDLTEMFRGTNTPALTNDWVNAACKVIQGNQSASNQNNGIWASNSFLMNNVETTTRALPKSLVEWELFNKSELPFHLSASNAAADPSGKLLLPDNGATGRGSVRVERSVARFDFKDGSQNGDRKYNVLFHSHNGVLQEAEPLVVVELQKMALVNMSNSFYYLPRVSADGLLNNSEICGREIGWDRDPATGSYSKGNYVVGPYADVFKSTVESDFTNYFNYPLFENDGTFNNATMATERWDVYFVSDVLAGTKTDNYDGKHDYKVWRYVTENVIPVDPLNQQNGISTGIVFKARMLGTDFAKNLQSSQHDAAWERGMISAIANCLNGAGYTQTDGSQHKPIVGNSKEDPILYYIDGKLYLTWRHIRQAAVQASVTVNSLNNVEINRSNSLYRAVFGNGGIPAGNVYIKDDGTSVAVNDPQFEALKAEYEKSADYAWQLWNDAGKPVPAQVGVNVPETLVAMRKAVTAAGISIFQSSIDIDKEGQEVPGYYCYYYYWNRHNDNLISGVMGPMEFAVVRNNVYKLSVDKISRLGHPRIPTNDPNTPTPGTPDESDEIYLDVTVEIADWAVRLNSIIF
ncbi:MAG: fimbria major subunit [Muribaculaceae bacterium]|nr:fimbria major subunit [Muribaculaceae bacterium]